MLGRGEFLHKWNAHLRQFLEIRYDLNDEMQTLKPQILSDLGFDSDASSVGRCYFNLNNIPIQTLLKLIVQLPSLPVYHELLILFATVY